MITIELQISLVLLFALAGYLFSSRINQSAVVGIILIGIVIGPSLLNIVGYSEAIKMLAHLGAIMLLFAIGLEFRIRDIYQMQYLFIAFIGIVIPWAAGYFLSLGFGYTFAESMVIGVALTATSIAITARVLEEMKKLNTAAARAIIGAAVIDDILGLLALSIALQSVKGTLHLMEIGAMVVKAVAFMTAGLLAAPFIKKLFVRLDENRFAATYPEFLFITAIMFCFLYASIAELIGLSAIVGSFLSGAALEGVQLKNSRGLKEGAEYLHVIFGAIFFVSMGILVNIKDASFHLVPFFAALLLTAIATKVLGCGVASALVGYTKKESLIIGLGMSPRGEVAMIIALIGLTSQTIGQDIYVSIVLMSLMTTIITPLAMRSLKW